MTQIKERKKYYLGKCDYNGSGRKNCKAFVTWDFEDGNLAMQAEIWNLRETDIYIGGQCLEEVAAFFPENKTAQQMLAIWKRWHLNDLNAGCEHQRKWKWTHNKLGLNCPICHYQYGSKWLKEEIPSDVTEIIQHW